MPPSWARAVITWWVPLVVTSCLIGGLLASPAAAHSLELVPSDSPIYTDLSRLASQGWIPLWSASMRPLTRLEIARMVARALDRVDANRPRRPARAELDTLERLVLEFAQELPLAGYRVVEPPQGPSAQAITGWGFRVQRVFVGRVERGTAPWFETPTPTGSTLRLETSATLGLGPGLAVSARVQQPFIPQLTFPYVDRVSASVGVYGELGTEVANSQIGTMTHWWGPSGQGAFLLSDNAGAPETIRVTTEGPQVRLVKLLAPLSVANQRYLYAMRADWLATDNLRLGFGEAMVASGDVYLPYVLAPIPLLNYAVGLWFRQQQQGLPDSYNAAVDFDWRIGEGTVVYGEVYADKISSGSSPFPSTGAAAAGLFIANVLPASQVDLRLEHSRATNWIYATPPPGTNNYTRLGKSIGHWCAPDCELWSAELGHRLNQQTAMRFGYDLVKKGAGVLGQFYVSPTDAWTNLYLSGVVETTQAWHFRLLLTPDGPFRNELGVTWSTVSNAGHVSGATQQNWYGWWEARIEW
jgi:hypothetical protein